MVIAEPQEIDQGLVQRLREMVRGVFSKQSSTLKNEHIVELTPIVRSYNSHGQRQDLVSSSKEQKAKQDVDAKKNGFYKHLSG